jgi:hypothetical protein
MASCVSATTRKERFVLMGRVRFSVYESEGGSDV